MTPETIQMETPEIQYCEDCAECKPFQTTPGNLPYKETIRLADCKAYLQEPAQPVTLGRNVLPEPKLQACSTIRLADEPGNTCSKFKPKEG